MNPPDPRADLDDLARRVRERRAEALEPLPPRPPGCAVCANWRLREGETRHEDGHVTTCALRGAHDQEGTSHEG